MFSARSASNQNTVGLTRMGSCRLDEIVHVISAVYTIER